MALSTDISSPFKVPAEAMAVLEHDDAFRSLRQRGSESRYADLFLSKKQQTNNAVSAHFITMNAASNSTPSSNCTVTSSTPFYSPCSKSTIKQHK